MLLDLYLPSTIQYMCIYIYIYISINNIYIYYIYIYIWQFLVCLAVSSLIGIHYIKTHDGCVTITPPPPHPQQNKLINELFDGPIN